MLTALVSTKGARRWDAGHPWIYRSDVLERPAGDAGAVHVTDQRGKPLGTALWSPRSEISLRLIDRDPDAAITAGWWRERIARAIARRDGLDTETNAYRLIHGEGDGLPSLVVDRYDRWLVVQLMSAGLEHFRTEIVDALRELTEPAGILARNDVPLRAKEGLPVEVELLSGTVPDEIEVQELGIRYLAAPWRGQKTGAFLDQRENRALVGRVAKGMALDCFSYHGSFALHLARGARSVTALDSSAHALARAEENFRRNGFTNGSFVEANAFEYLRARERDNVRFDTIVLDPPAFAKTRQSLPAALRGYKDINLRAMRILNPGGVLVSCSCSYNVDEPLFLQVLADAAADARAHVTILEKRMQGRDHPVLLTVPETYYLKCVILRKR